MGKIFPELHVQIMNFKKWLIGVHRHRAEHYLQKYQSWFGISEASTKKRSR